MTYQTSRLVINVLMAVFVVVLAGFAVAFGVLLYKAFSLVGFSVGLNTSFTGYEYISIEATFVFLMLYGGYWVFRNAARRPTIEVDVLE